MDHPKPAEHQVGVGSGVVVAVDVDVVPLRVGVLAVLVPVAGGGVAGDVVGALVGALVGETVGARVVVWVGDAVDSRGVGVLVPPLTTGVWFAGVVVTGGGRTQR